MAENTIDNLSIQVVASAERAISTFNRLASGASGLRGAARGAAGGMQNAAQGARDMGTATQEAGIQTGNATISVGRFWNALRGVGSQISSGFVRAVHRGTAAIGVFLKSIARIAFYRAIRSIIKDIGQSFKDLYGYSRLFGTDFAKSMDRITTATTYMRNSFAAMVAPLVNAFAPLIDWLADKIVGLMNFINQLFAAINGQETYTVAKKVATTWESTFDSSANHAKKKIKEVKNTLLGFDEINRLNGETPSSSGNTGSSPYTPGYSTMFEEKPLEGFFAKLSGFMSGMPDWVKWLFGGGTLIGGFLLIKNFLPWVIGKIGEIFLMTPPEWISWLFGSTKKVVEVAVSLVRYGWETIKGWAVSFGEAVVDLAVRVKTKIADLWASIVTAWNALNPVLQVGIVIGVTAAALWAAYQLAWQLVPDKMLAVESYIKTTASALWESIQKSWDNLKNTSLAVAVSLITTVASLWDGITNAWGAAKNRVLYITTSIATTAASMWDGVVSAWGAAKNRVLYITTSIATTAASMWNGVVSKWGAAKNRVLYITTSIATTAASMWNGVVSAWGAAKNRVLYITTSIATTAASMWNGVVSAWGAAKNRVLYITTSIATTATSMWKSIQDAWGKAQNHVLDVTIGAKSNIKTAVDNVWSWVKDHWKIIAAGALGIAIAIATPWSTIATALSGLWADVMASFGGALAFSIVPTLGKIFGGSKGKAAELNPNTSYYDNSTGELVIKAQPTEVTVNAKPGTGLSRNDANGLSVNPVKTTPASQPISLEKYGWSWVNTWVEKFAQTNVLQYIALAKLWWDTVSGWVSGSKGNTIDQLVGLMKYGWNWVDEWAKQYAQTPIQQKVDLVLGTDYVTGGGTGKGVVTHTTKALGGIFENGFWSSIPQYANGTTNAHGSLFLAGEAGPEIVGNVGGRTEVLNKSQLASAMYSAVQAAMAPAAANFASAAQSMGVVNVSFDFETLAEMIRQGVEQAMGRQNELDRQRNEYLRQINEKEFSADISTNSINKAQQRMNRRAGTTIVAIG